MDTVGEIGDHLQVVLDPDHGHIEFVLDAQDEAREILALLPIEAETRAGDPDRHDRRVLIVNRSLLRLLPAVAAVAALVPAAFALGGPAPVADPLLPDLDQRLPLAVSVRLGGPPNHHPLLVFTSSVENVGYGPLLVEGHRAKAGIVDVGGERRGPVRRPERPRDEARPRSVGGLHRLDRPAEARGQVAAAARHLLGLGNRDCPLRFDLASGCRRTVGRVDYPATAAGVVMWLWIISYGW